VVVARTAEAQHGRAVEASHGAEHWWRGSREDQKVSRRWRCDGMGSIDGSREVRASEGENETDRGRSRRSRGLCLVPACCSSCSWLWSMAQAVKFVIVAAGALAGGALGFRVTKHLEQKARVHDHISLLSLSRDLSISRSSALNQSIESGAAQGRVATDHGG